ncbi:MAG: hypothetical protein E5W06_05055 [Mesorhizobium sp.]|nr:MAG: hypothetical protein E5W06_05055 [Mesorhizobium sp.]
MENDFIDASLGLGAKKASSSSDIPGLPELDIYDGSCRNTSLKELTPHRRPQILEQALPNRQTFKQTEF